MLSELNDKHLLWMFHIRLSHLSTRSYLRTLWIIAYILFCWWCRKEKKCHRSAIHVYRLVRLHHAGPKNYQSVALWRDVPCVTVVRSMQGYVCRVNVAFVRAVWRNCCLRTVQLWQPVQSAREYIMNGVFNYSAHNLHIKSYPPRVLVYRTSKIYDFDSLASGVTLSVLKLSDALIHAKPLILVEKRVCATDQHPLHAMSGFASIALQRDAVRFEQRNSAWIVMSLCVRNTSRYVSWSINLTIFNPCTHRL